MTQPTSSDALPPILAPPPPPARTLCFCNTTVAWGGGEKWHLEAAVNMAARGWQVILMCHPDGALYKKAQQHPELILYPVALSRLAFLNPFTIRTLTQFFRQYPIHAVILNSPAELKSIAPIAKKFRIKHIIYRRGSAIAVKNTCINRYLFGILTGLIVNSQETKRQVLAHNPNLIADDKIHLISNGIDINAFDKALTKAATYTLPAPEQFASSDMRPLVIGNAGRLNKQKAQHYLLYIGKALSTAHIPFHLVIAGTGDEEKALRALAQELDITAHVTFSGFLEDLSPFWRAIDVFMLTSQWEGFGYVLLEAMLARKPVLAFATSNIPELIHDTNNGYLFPLPPQPTGSARQTKGLSPDTVIPGIKDIVETLRSLANSSEQRTMLGTHGREFAIEHFSQQKQMDILNDLLTSS